MLRFVKAILVLVALVVIPTIADAQASIVGTVRDSSGAVIPGGSVEAASPVLIEKTRSVVTNESGRYSIEDLRPGSYAVTFTLPGFSTVKREGIELAGAFIATVNADMKVGGVTDTVTVSAESPIVDTTSTRDQEVISNTTVGRSQRPGSIPLLRISFLRSMFSRMISKVPTRHSTVCSRSTADGETRGRFSWTA